MAEQKDKKVPRWYFGGLSAAAAALFTHPLDLLKVHLQTQQEGKLSLNSMTVKVVKEEGFFALYNGLSASLLRQLTYSTVRFGAYEIGKQSIETPDHPTTFGQKLYLSGFAGMAGGVVGTPGDLVNVRMQNDVKLPKDKRRNYTWAGNGLLRIWKEEGFSRLFSGCVMATTRATVITMAQLSCYDQIKQMMLASGKFKDDITTHFSASLAAGAIATTATQPLDVMKTRAMNAKPGEFKSLIHLFLYTAKMGPLAFFKGFIPAFVRIAPHTILTFLILEKLRYHFGVYPSQNR